MTKNDILTKVAACITTLAETGGSPESMLYIALTNSNLQDWNDLRDTMVKVGFIQVTNHYVTLTDLGLTTAAKIEAKLAETPKYKAS